MRRSWLTWLERVEDSPAVLSPVDIASPVAKGVFLIERGFPGHTAKCFWSIVNLVNKDINRHQLGYIP